MVGSELQQLEAAADHDSISKLTDLSAKFSEIGIKSALILNAGALLIYPNIALSGSFGAIKRGIAVNLLSISFCLFMVGVLTSALSCLFAFLNAQVGIEYYRASVDIRQLQARDAVEHNEALAVVLREKWNFRDRVSRWANGYRMAAIGCAVLSYLVFFGGCVFGVLFLWYSANSRSGVLTAIWGAFF